MRYVLMATVGVASLALAGCSKTDSSSFNNGSFSAAPASIPQSEPAMRDVAEGAAPGIAVTAAPGVAFTYRYAFRLPAAKLAAAQEAHAQACEKLGVAHCRITGMRYRVLGENSNEGQLLFKLDPSLARAFGKQGIDAIVAAEGKLTDAEITGTDAGAEIAKLQSLKAQAAAELQRIDRELARKDLKEDERAELQRQRASITSQITDAKTGTSDQQEALANTPMEFDYQSGPAVQGFDGSAPITSAANVFVGSATVTIGFVLTMLAVLIPPGIIVLGGFLLWRRFRPRRKPVETAA
ncbi:hypothetical protein [Sphingomonas bacterium]|uniref:hypothetical protein n=1 Tax=Sphingomonas bacterium TaxID=1895847 RepID=UPI0026116777|nr:hypothetical protein [Sphingomonas bacterium]MDB5679469.1 hypothetical protein [Sphingomonas bacterium]